MIFSFSNGSIVISQAVVTPSDLSPIQRGTLAVLLKDVLTNASIPIGDDGMHSIKSVTLRRGDTSGSFSLITVNRTQRCTQILQQ